MQVTFVNQPLTIHNEYWKNSAYSHCLFKILEVTLFFGTKIQQLNSTGVPQALLLVLKQVLAQFFLPCFYSVHMCFQTRRSKLFCIYYS